MPLYSKNKVLDAARKASYKYRDKDIKKELRSLSESASTYDTFDIFLSHSYLDGMLILGVKEIAESMNYSVYIDWVDDQELDRSKVSRATAQRLRSRMKQCKSLFFATSDNHSNSKWMPWELGYFDGIKGKAAIFPIVDQEDEVIFGGQEYLGLYPFISSGTNSFWVEGAGELRLFSDWIK